MHHHRSRPDSRSNSPALLATASVASLCALLAGCMTVQIEASDGQVTVLRHMGLLQIEVPQSDRAVVGALQGVGLVSTPMGWTAGYTRQRWAAIGPQCRVVLWVNESATIDEETRHRLSSLAGVCLVEDGEQPILERGANANREIKP